MCNRIGSKLKSKAQKNDVQQNWKQVHDKQMHVNWNKMKKIGG
jgi:hypothetical protein